MGLHRYYFLVVFLLLQLNQSSAEEVNRRFAIGGFGSFVKMVGGDIDRSTIDQWMGIRLKYNYSPRIAMDLNLGYGWVYARNPESSQFASTEGFRTNLVPFFADFIVFATSNENIRPFLSFGFGLTSWDTRELKGAAFSVLPKGESVYGAQTDATLLVGTGVEFKIRERLYSDVSLKYHRLLKGNEDTMGPGDDGNDGILELRLSMSYYLGIVKDMDGDGIPDDKDADRIHAEDLDGYLDDDGAPDPDNDHDGIPDILDGAPNEPEDFDSFEDEDGIPDYDNDGDSIADQYDKCDFEKEDFDGFEDEDGCPDVDNDNDSIPDSVDSCPNWPEDFNGFQDEDGCPDQKPEVPPYKVGERVVLRNVRFEENVAELTTDSYTRLEELVDALLKFPDMQIEIRGYTDSKGNWGVNERISQQRANAVKEYLVSRGIDGKRLTATGMGERDPIAPNTSDVNRAANRRIEFTRIK